jgi:hypothetical protein
MRGSLLEGLAERGGFERLHGIENTEVIDLRLRQAQYLQVMRLTIARYCTLTLRPAYFSPLSERLAWNTISPSIWLVSQMNREVQRYWSSFRCLANRSK